MPTDPPTAKNILVVDDEPLMRRAIVRLLGTKCFQVHDVGDDAEAMDALAHTNFDLAIIDVVLIGMGGPELAGLLRQALPQMAVLFISGYDKNIVAQKGVDPAEHFLQKPFSRVDLLEIMQKALREVGAQ